MRRLAGAAVIAMGCSLAGWALAVEPDAQPSTPGAVSYAASPGCPGEAEFWRHVASHLAAAPEPAKRPISVEAFERESGALVRVTFAGADATEDVRKLSAPTCAEAVAAAALVVALALDARGDAARPAAAARPSTPASKAPGSTNDSGAARASPVSMVLPDQVSSRQKAGRGLRLLFGGGGFLEYALAPAPMLGATAFIGLTGDRRSWDARAGFTYSRTGSVERNAERAEFSLIAARIDGCAFPFVHGERFALHPCLAVELGAAQSRGEDSELYRGADKSTFWGAGGPLLRARQLFDELALELHAGPWIPFAGTRTFVFRGPGNRQSFHEVPPVGVVAGAGLAFAVP
jgi:hypothetical protein